MDLWLSARSLSVRAFVKKCRVFLCGRAQMVGVRCDECAEMPFIRATFEMENIWATWLKKCVLLKYGKNHWGKLLPRFKRLFHSFFPPYGNTVKLIGEPEKSTKLISPSVSGNWLVLIHGRFCEKKKGTSLYSWCAGPMLHLGKKWGCMKPLCSPCSHLPQGGQVEKLADRKEQLS